MCIVTYPENLIWEMVSVMSRNVSPLMVAYGLFVVAVVALVLARPSCRTGRTSADTGSEPAANDGRRNREGGNAAGNTGGTNRFARAERVETPVFLAALHAEDGSAAEDVRLLDELFGQYRTAVKTGNPIGNNREITAALRGRNRLGLRCLADDHPALNDHGELCDRWGTPYFFHQVSATRMEVRSAGPDREMYTGDDVVTPPAR